MTASPDQEAFIGFLRDLVQDGRIGREIQKQPELTSPQVQASQNMIINSLRAAEILNFEARISEAERLVAEAIAALLAP